MDAIYIIGIFLTFFISALLFTKNGKTLPDKILAVWMICVGLHLLHFYTYTLDYWTTYPHLVGLTAPFPLLYGPLLYLYIIHSIRGEKRLRKPDYLHFLPFVLSYLYMFKFFFFYTVKEKHLVDIGELNTFSTFSSLLLIAYVFSFITYPILSLKLLTKHQKLLAENFSFEEGINFKWLKNIVFCLGGGFLITIIVLALQRIIGFEFGFRADNIFYGLFILLIVIFGFYGVRQMNLFSSQLQPVLDMKPEYKNSGLKATVAEEYHRQLLDIMEKGKPYLDSRLSLSKLASIIGISSNNLSQVINQYEKVNFSDFINKYRIEEFKIQREKNPDFSILALALEAGFNSKSAFNNIFKKQTGKTPSQYLSEI